MKIYDLSRTIGEVSKGPLAEKIHYTNHKKGGDLLGLSLIFSPGKKKQNILFDLLKYILGIRKVNHKDFPDRIGLSKETVKLSTHSGTHMDSPYHFGVEIEGQKALTIDKMPLDWFYGEGIMLDFSEFSKLGRRMITKDDVVNELKRIDVQLQAGYIVLIKTSTQKNSKHVGMSREATEYCIENGVKVMGIDSVGFDCPFEDMLEEYVKSKNRDKLWPAHLYGREKQYCHMENLYLEEFHIQKNFKVYCFPVKVLNASAGWVRAVAIIE